MSMHIYLYKQIHPSYIYRCCLSPSPHFFMVGIVLAMLFGAGYFWLFVSALTFPKLFMSFFKHVMASNSLLNSFLDFSRWELLTRGLNPLISSPPPPDLLRLFIEVMRRLSSYWSYLFLRCPPSRYSMLLTSLFSWFLVLSRLIFMSYWIELPSSKTAGFTKILLPSADCRAFSRHSSSRMLIWCDISLMIFFWLSSSSTIIFLKLLNYSLILLSSRCRYWCSSSSEKRI